MGDSLEASLVRYLDTNGELSYPQRGLHGRVVDELGRRILGGGLLPGATLPREDSLRAEFDASRTVIREAVRVLAAKGLVESRPKSGTKVRPRGNWNLLDPDVLTWKYRAGIDEGFLQNLTEVREIIEPAAAGLAATRARDEEVERLEQQYARLEAAVDDPRDYILADMPFHSMILSACHNDVLEQMTKTISVALIISRKITVQLPGSSEASLPYHRAVVDGIKGRDGAAARAAMETLIRYTASGMKEAMDLVPEGPDEE